MNISSSTYHDEEIKYYSIDCFDALPVKAFYTSIQNSKWKYGNEGSTENFEKLSSLLKIPVTQMCTTNQTHTAVVRSMSKGNGGEGILKPTEGGEYDGIVTSEKNLLLCSFEADCVPVYFYDKLNKVAAISHSGWKGTASEISKVTVEKMKNEFSSQPENIIAVIGPCACNTCYEVGPELLVHFDHAFHNELSEIFVPKDDEKYILNLTRAIEITLLRNGISEKNIFTVDKCTIESDDLCSYRRTKSKTDHMLTAIMME